MGKLSDLFGQEASRQAAKAAADAVWTQKSGVGAYCLIGKIFAGCGVGWLALSLIPMLCKNPISDIVWMWILAMVQIILGLLLVILSKKSGKFQWWAEKDFRKGLKQQKKLEEKVKIGKMVLPMTHGDLLALKILAILAVILIALLGVGYLQGWVV